MMLSKRINSSLKWGPITLIIIFLFSVQIDVLASENNLSSDFRGGKSELGVSVTQKNEEKDDGDKKPPKRTITNVYEPVAKPIRTLPKTGEILSMALLMTLGLALLVFISGLAVMKNIYQTYS